MVRRSISSLTLALMLVSATLSGAAAISPSTLPAAEAPSKSRNLNDEIREATGLRFRVLESIIRRNIISTRTPYGFKIRSVDDDSPADRAGLKKGDVLLEWDGKPIKSRTDLKQWLDEAERGVEIPVVYARLKSKRSLLDRRPWVEHESTMTLGDPKQEP